MESLRLCTEISDSPATEAALIERVARLASFSHPAFPRARRVERLDGVAAGLALVSEAVPGCRLSDALRQAERTWLEPDFSAAISIIQQMTTAMSALHQVGRDVSHGALAPERIVIRPDGSVAIVEHVLGPALERLQMGRTQLWTLFRVAVPPVAGTARFDQLTDVLQMGIVALSLSLGRLLHRDEYPQKVAELLQEASTADPLTGRPVLSRSLRGWIARLLQLDARTGFRTAQAAAAALPAALADEPRWKPSQAAVKDYLARCAVEPTLPQGVVVPSASGRHAATVTVGPIEPPKAVVVDRGSGAHRVAVPLPEPKPTQVRVLADVGAARNAASPSSGSAPAARPSRSASGRPFLRRVVRVAATCVALLLLWGATYLGARTVLGFPTFAPRMGTVVIESRPAGVAVTVDGEPAGVTPATLQLKAGEHTVTLVTTKGTTVLPVTVVAGSQTTERVEVRQGNRLAKRTPKPRPPAPKPES